MLSFAIRSLKDWKWWRLDEAVPPFTNFRGRSLLVEEIAVISTACDDDADNHRQNWRGGRAVVDFRTVIIFVKSGFVISDAKNRYLKYLHYPGMLPGNIPGNWSVVSVPFWTYSNPHLTQGTYLNQIKVQAQCWISFTMRSDRFDT